MLLHQPGQKITRPHIVMLLGASGEVIPQKPDNRFMISQKIGDHLGGFRISRLLFEPGLAHKLGERPVIAQLYKCRWQVELFFKWIKQHMRIKAFYGTTENTVKTQIWIAICVYVLVAIIKKASEARPQPLHNSTNSECAAVRENAHITSAFFN